jgi:hypothetical protein
LVISQKKKKKTTNFDYFQNIKKEKEWVVFFCEEIDEIWETI